MESAVKWSEYGGSVVSNRGLEQPSAMEPMGVALQTNASIWNLRRAPLSSLLTPELLAEKLEAALDRRDHQVEILQRTSQKLNDISVLKLDRLDLSNADVKQFYK